MACLRVVPAVRIRGIEEIDPGIKRAVQDSGCTSFRSGSVESRMQPMPTSGSLSFVHPLVVIADYAHDHFVESSSDAKCEGVVYRDGCVRLRAAR